MSKEFTKYLLAEASNRIERPIVRIASKDVDIKSYLLEQAQDLHRKHKTKKMASLEKRGMSYFVGQGEFRNSNVRWQKVDMTPHMEMVDDQLYQSFRPYFYSLIQGKQVAIIPPQLVLRYEAIRELFPLDDKSTNARQDAELSVDILENIVPGFKEFVAALQSSPMPVSIYFQGQPRSKKDGGVDSKDLRQFVADERQRMQQAPLQLGNIPLGKYFYRDHLNVGRLQPTIQYQTNRLYSPEDVAEKTSPVKLKRWIDYAINNGYILNESAVQQHIEKLQNEILSKNKLLKGNFTDLQKQQRRSIVMKFTGVDPENNSGRPFQNSMLGRIQTAMSKACSKNGLPMQGSGKHQYCPILTLQEMQILARYLHGNHPEIGENALIPNESTTYRANGFDSMPGSPETAMPVIPAMKQLPTGQIVYDRDQGNLMGNHCRKYGPVIKDFLGQWGQWAEQAMKALLSGKAAQHLTQLTEERYSEGTDSQVAFDAYRTILLNRTNADNVLESSGKYNDYRTFFADMIKRTLATEIRLFNAFSEDYQASGVKHFVQGGDHLQAIQQLNQVLSPRIAKLSEQLRGTRNAEEKARIKQALDALVSKARNDLSEIGYELTQQVKQGQMDWTQYVKGLDAIGSVVGQNGRPIIKTHSMAESDFEQVIDQQGFELWKKYGYVTAKLMDLVNALMIRSCNDSTNNRWIGGVDENGQPETVNENFFGANYATTHGKAGSTTIMLGVRYAYRAQEIGSHDEELLKRVRFHRGKRKMKVPPTGTDVLPQTIHPQRGTQIDPSLTPAPNAAAKIIEQLAYWVGQAASTQHFHRALESESIAENASWEQAVDYIRQKYPDLENQIGSISQPVSVDLRRLQEASKRALAKVVEELDVEAVYEDSEGQQTVIDPDNIVPDEVMAAQFNMSAQDSNLAVVEDEESMLPQEDTDQQEPSVEDSIVEQPLQTEEVDQPNEPQLTEEIDEDSLPDDILALINSKSELAETPQDWDAIANIEADLLSGKIDHDTALNSLNSLFVEPGEEDSWDRDSVTALMDIWENKLLAGVPMPSEVADTLYSYYERYGVVLPPNVQKEINRHRNRGVMQSPEQAAPVVDEGVKEPYNPDLDEDNYMEMKSMPQESVDFVGKRQNKPKLIKHRPDPGTGKLRRSDIIDMLTKTATRLDDMGEVILASKIDLLIRKMIGD